MSKVFTHITELPYYNFIEASVTGDLKHLVIEGEPTKEELDFIWHEIQSQYAEAIGDGEQVYSLKLIKDISNAETKFNNVVRLVFLLRSRYVDVFANMLNGILNTSFKFDITQTETYDKELDRCLKRAKAFEIDYKRKAIELQAIIDKRGSKGEKPTREYYYRLLNAISKHIGFKLVAKEITVFEFTDFLQQMTKEAAKHGRG